MIAEYLKQHDNVYDFLLEYCEKVNSFYSYPIHYSIVEYICFCNYYPK